MQKTILVTIILMALLLLGCIGEGTENSFALGEDFNLFASQIFTNDSNFVKVTVLEVTDSRCPSGVQCFWEGELGALINVKQFSDISFETILLDENINLGLLTRPTSNVLNNKFLVTLVGVDFDSNKLSLKVDSLNDELFLEKKWFVISPKQCQSNLWDVWALESGIRIKKSAEMSMGEALIPIWLEKKYFINSYETKSHVASEVVCQACSCPTGEQIAVLVDGNYKSMLINLGFSMIESPIACTMDAMVCSDGSAVGRTAPFCDFEKCPINNLNNSSDENVLIVVTKFPGFVINPSTKVITIGRAYFTIEESSRFWDEKSQDWNETITSHSDTLELSEFDSLVSLIKSTNFFDLTGNDVRPCMVDNSSTNINITIGNLTNVLYGIGSECDTNKTSEVYSILERVDLLTTSIN
ncbi:MAG: hypothetical protein WCX66_01585 [archaeon]|jgi:hypothetical protein